MAGMGIIFPSLPSFIRPMVSAEKNNFILSVNNTGVRTSVKTNGGKIMGKDSHAPKKKNNKAKLPNEQRRSKGKSNARGGRN